ncbi:MAG: SRPBCC domain-containing protein [Gemmatimonadota bacterium]
MTPDHAGSHELSFERTLRAPVDRVWAALTDAGQVEQWYGPGEEFRIEVEEWDCRIGGKYRVAMHHRDGQTHTCYGEFKDLEPNRRIAYTWAWADQPPLDTLVTFALTAEGDQTRLHFTHAGFPSEEVRGQHEMGWTGSLERLAGVVA